MPPRTRGDQRQGPRDESRGDSQGGSRGGARGGSRGGSRGDSRSGPRGGGRGRAANGFHGANQNSRGRGFQQNQPPQHQEQSGERRKFVPWLGEERPGKAPIINLEEYKDQSVFVAFAGGRQVEGRLTGFDQALNLVLEDAVEDLGSNGSRRLGTLVAVGLQLQSIAPVMGSAPIENPF